MGTEQLRVGLVGAGGMGRALVEGMEKHGLGVLVAAAEPVEENRARIDENRGIALYADYREMFESESLDAALVATPADMHRDPVIAAARARVPVFVEKPMACAVEGCRAMIAACREAGVGLMVGQVLRFFPCWAEVIELVRQGRIGRPLGIHITRTGGGWKRTERAWRFERGRCGGLLGEVNAHELDFMRTVMGEPESVFCRGGKVVPDSGADYEDLLFVSFEFESGGVGLLHSGLCSAVGELTGRIYGEEGTIAYADGFQDQGTITAARFGAEPETILVGDVKKRRPDPVAEEVRLFLEAARTGGSMPVPGLEGLMNTAAAHAAYLSLERNAPVTLAEVLGRDPAEDTGRATARGDGSEA